jgi:hypothetical protein
MYTVLPVLAGACWRFCTHRREIRKTMQGPPLQVMCDGIKVTTPHMYVYVRPVDTAGSCIVPAREQITA